MSVRHVSTLVVLVLFKRRLFCLGVLHLKRKNKGAGYILSAASDFNFPICNPPPLPLPELNMQSFELTGLESAPTLPLSSENQTVCFTAMLAQKDPLTIQSSQA